MLTSGGRDLSVVLLGLPNTQDVFSHEDTEASFHFRVNLLLNTFHFWETSCSSVPAHKQAFLEVVREFQIAHASNSEGEANSHAPVE